MAIVTAAAFSWPRRLAFLWLGLVLAAAVLAPVLPLPYPPGVPDLAHLAQAPLGTGQHWLGTDPDGRDVLSVLVFGARTAVLLTLPAALLAAFIGAGLGGAAGFWGNTLSVSLPYWVLAAGGAWWAARLPFPLLGLGLAAVGVGLAVGFRRRRLPSLPLPLGSVVLGAAVTLDTIPRLVLVVAMAAGTGLSTGGLLILFTLTAWPHPARLVRAQMLRVRVLPFIDAAHAAGVPAWRVWLRHAMPHAIRPLRAVLPLSLMSLLGLESTLSFLGIGLPPDVASWGRLMATIRNEPSAWWVFIFPVSILILSILSLTTLSKSQQAHTGYGR